VSAKARRETRTAERTEKRRIRLPRRNRRVPIREIRRPQVYLRHKVRCSHRALNDGRVGGSAGVSEVIEGDIVRYVESALRGYVGDGGGRARGGERGGSGKVLGPICRKREVNNLARKDEEKRRKTHLVLLSTYSFRPGSW
jgi:hypothetical protein